MKLIAKFTITVLILGIAHLPAAQANQPYQVISDFDDTIKITNVQNPVDAAKNSVLGKDFFTGTKALFTGFINQNSPVSIK